MSNARELAQIPSTPSGRRNLIINGAFEIAQRSTSEETGSVYATVDRWRFPNTSQASQQVVNDRDLSIPKMLKSISTTSGYGIINQRIEDVTKTSGKTLTLSFWAKTSDYSSLRLFCGQNFGSGGSSSVYPIDNATYFSVPDTGWNYYTATFSLGSVSGKTIGASSFVDFGIGPNSGTSEGIVYYSEVQLEVGTVATEFEHRSFGEELALCQRYYQLIDSCRKIPAIRFKTSGGSPYGNITFCNAMRTSPSFSYTGTWITATGYAGTPTLQLSGTTSAAFAGSTIFSANDSGWFDSTDGSIVLDAEL